jgi:hypothetical protein
MVPQDIVFPLSRDATRNENDCIHDIFAPHFIRARVGAASYRALKDSSTTSPCRFPSVQQTSGRSDRGARAG